MASEYKNKISQIKEEQATTESHISEIADGISEAYEAVRERGGQVPLASNQKLGTNLNASIASIKTDNIPVDADSEAVYWGADADGCYISPLLADVTDVAFGLDQTGLYGRNQE